MKVINIILFIILLIGILFLSYQIWIKDKGKPDPKDIYKYKTDTLYENKPYPYPDPYLIITKPRYFTFYQVDSTAIDSLELELRDKEIIISGLEEEIRIHENFLKQYPYNPKLVELNLNKDTLSLSLLNIQGLIFKQDYPLYLDQYKYKWSHPDFSREKIKTKPKDPSFTLSSYVFVGYSLYPNSPIISNSWELSRGKIRLSSNVGILFKENKPIYLDLKLGYKFY